MARAYNVIDADGHILEPLDLWQRYMDPAYRDQAPSTVLDDNGKTRLLIGGKMLGSEKGLGNLGAVGARDGTVVVDDAREYEQGRKGGFDPHARIVDMDREGIDAAFLYPSLGLFLGGMKDPDAAAAQAEVEAFVDEEALVAFAVDDQLGAVVAVLGIDVPFPQIGRLQDMAVRVDDVVFTGHHIHLAAEDVVSELSKAPRAEHT